MTLGTNMNITRDVAGNATFGLPFALFKYDTTLVTSVEQTLTIPGAYKKYLAIFSIEPGTSLWIASDDNTATLPGAAFAATDSELNPVAREVKADEILHFITGNATAVLGVTLYPISS